MIIRALIGAGCLIAIGVGAAHAQTVPNGDPRTDAQVIDGTRKTPDTPAPVPEVVVPPGSHGDVIEPKTNTDASSVVRPPNVDPGMTVLRGQSAGGNQPVDPK